MQRCKTPIDIEGKTILVTGSPGFIGFHLVTKLLSEMPNGTIVSFDNMNDYYDVTLKEWRLEQIENKAESSSVNHIYEKGDISDAKAVNDLFEKYNFDIVVNLAAQAGVRYSIDHPGEYVKTNVVGFYNILEACRLHKVKHLVFASSSTVYGLNKKIPFSIQDKTDSPVSLYAATKKADELMAFAYAKLYGIPTTGLRFFTVYGPAGRPDMFYFKAAEKMISGEMISIYNYGEMERDFTYVGDVAECIFRTIKKPPYVIDFDCENEQDVPFAVYNVGKGCPENLLHFAITLCTKLKDEGLISEDYDLEEHIDFKEMPKGDVPITFAQTSEFYEDFGFRPSTTIEEGLEKFASWLALVV